MDAGWATFIVTVCTIFVAIGIYFLQRNRKTLAYQIIWVTNVLRVRGEKDIQSRVQVLFDNKPVTDVYVVILKLWNRGNTPININDYYHDNPIEIDFGVETQVLEADVLETKPKNIEAEVKASLKFNVGKVIINPVLLNSRSFIILKVLITQFNDRERVKMDNTGIIGGQTLNWDKTFLARAKKSPYMLYLLFVSMVIFTLIFTIIAGILASYISKFITTYLSLRYDIMFVIVWIILTCIFIGILYKFFKWLTDRVFIT